MNNADQIKALTDAYLNTMWTCGDCGNIYENLVFHCPNENYDNLLVTGILNAPEETPQPYVNTTVTMSSSNGTGTGTGTPEAYCPKCGERWHGEVCSVGESDDPLVIAIADALFENWFKGMTVDDLKQRGAYNGEYEIAVEDAKIAAAAGYEHLGLQQR